MPAAVLLGWCRYGVGMAVGFTALVILKRAIRSVPIVGPLSKPLLGES